MAVQPVVPVAQPVPRAPHSPAPSLACLPHLHSPRVGGSAVPTEGRRNGCGRAPSSCAVFARNSSVPGHSHFVFEVEIVLRENYSDRKVASQAQLLLPAYHLPQQMLLVGWRAAKGLQTPARCCSLAGALPGVQLCLL